MLTFPAVQHEGKPMPTAGIPFHQARPGRTHMALVGLHRAGILKYTISQVCLFFFIGLGF